MKKLYGRTTTAPHFYLHLRGDMKLTQSMSTLIPSITRTALRTYTKFMCGYVLFVIFAGALVTSHDAGLSVPDWPTTYGENMFLFPVYKWVGGIFYEHGHRLVAFGIGTLTLILAPWTWFVEDRRWVRNLTFAALGIVICQGLLGGLTVILKLPVLVSSAHAVLAQTFLGIVLILAYAHSTEYRATRNETVTTDSKLLGGAVLSLILIYLQLIIGAVMRHSQAGLAVLDFPTMGGSFIPSISESTIRHINEARQVIGFGEVTSHQVFLHLLHRGGAIAVSVVVIAFVWKACTLPGVSPRVKSLAQIFGGALFLQFALGVVTILSVRNPFIASFHVLTGALFLALAVLLTLRVRPQSTLRS